MRGKAVDLMIGLRSVGITPAYAGKSVLGDPRCHLSGDHPRLCGEKFVWRYVNYEKVGSPPPMRGKAPFRFVVVACGGITPAYAGKRAFCGELEKAG